MLAGFPCQPFSQAGLKKGFADVRGTLFFDIQRILKYHKPQIVFLENVQTLKTHDNGTTFTIIIENLERIGYEVFDQVLKSVDFGMAQNRKRFYIVGIYKQNNNIVDFEFPEGLEEKKNVKVILEKNVDEKYTISNHLWVSHQERKKRNKLNGKGFGYSLVNEESPYTRTISARYYKDGAEILIDQGTKKNPRKITPREAARLQGFPETFDIPVSDAQAYKQFGNAVPVPVIREISKKILNYL